MSPDDIALEILKINADGDQRRKWNNESKRWNFGSAEMGERSVDELFDLALDVLSVPKDQIGGNPEFYFCRDWLGDRWITLRQGNFSDQTIREFIRWVRLEVQVFTGRVPGCHNANTLKWEAA